jgi:hypothetical protein
MLTAWMTSQQERLAPSPWSAETQALIRKYATPVPERHRQLDEVTLTAIHGIIILLATALVALAGWLASLVGVHANATLATAYAGVAGGLCTGMFLHIARYFDALIGSSRAGRRRQMDGEAACPRGALRWPRASSDADFAVALAAGACFVVLSLSL